MRTQAPAFSGFRDMNNMYELFKGWTGRPVHKWHHYLDIYERYFSPLRGQPITLLEIGLGEGGSLAMWRQYLGVDARIIGIDIDPACAAYREPGIEIFIGDQSDPAFLCDVLERVPLLDVVIDDGGHTANQQIVSFETLYRQISPVGLYIVEDTHSSYWPAFCDRADGRTFVEYAKTLCDSLAAWHFDINNFLRYGVAPAEREGSVDVPWFTRCTRSISFYDSMIVFEKAKIEEPWHSRQTHSAVAS